MKKILLALLCISCIGCAAMFNDKTAKVQVTSEPSGADVYFNGLLVGTTPLTSIASEQIPLTIQISKTGYERAFKTIDTHTEGKWVLVDFLPPLPMISFALDLILARDMRNLQTLDEKEPHFVLKSTDNP